jgi:lysozyme family protein
MSSFDNCISFLLNNEGGILNDPQTGEDSNFGVTKGLLKQVNWYPKDPKQLNQDGAKNIYYIFFWQKYTLNSITSEVIAAKILDMIVNMGPRQAGLLLQRALNFTPDRTDGIIGYWTIADLNQWSEATVMPKLIEQCLDFYTKLAASDAKYEKYLAGWLTRAKKVPVISSAS